MLESAADVGVEKRCADEGACTAGCHGGCMNRALARDECSVSSYPTWNSRPIASRRAAVDNDRAGVAGGSGCTLESPEFEIDLDSVY